MGWEAAIISAIGALLAALAPEVRNAITGGQTPEEAVASAHAAQAKIPVLEDKGTWDAALDARKGRG